MQLISFHLELLMGDDTDRNFQDLRLGRKKIDWCIPSVQR